MGARGWAAVLCLSVTVGAFGPAAAQETDRKTLARELARLVMDDPARGDVQETVSARVMQYVAANLQERLNRRLLDMEWKMLGGIVRRFVTETFPSGRTDAIAAEVYMGYFDGAELSELVRFQSSAVGRKASRLAAAIARETAEAIDREVAESPAIPRLLDELRASFPVLGPEAP